jgi:hypothetical protein
MEIFFFLLIICLVIGSNSENSGEGEVINDRTNSDNFTIENHEDYYDESDKYENEILKNNEDYYDESYEDDSPSWEREGYYGIGELDSPSWEREGYGIGELDEANRNIWED